MKIGYIRVSTVEQNEDRQKMALEKYGIERWYVDKKSGKNMDRPEFKKMMDYLREDSNDIVYVSELSRLARSTLDLYSIIDKFKEKGVQFVSDKENIDTSTATGRAMFGFWAVMAQFERELIHERQAEGIAAARSKGKKFGRPRADVDEEEFETYYKGWQNRLYTVAEISRKLRISPATVYRLISSKKVMEKQSLRTD